MPETALPHARSADTASPQAPIQALTPMLFLVAGALLLASLTVWRFYLPAANGFDVSGNQIGRDFLNTWVGPQVAFHDGAAALYDQKGYMAKAAALFGKPLLFHNFSYPPSAIVLFWPFAQLPYFVGLAVWLCVTFAALAAVTLSQVSRVHALAAVGLLAIAPAVIVNGLSGQNGFLSGALLMGGLVLLDRRPLLAGVLFGLLSFKPHLGIVLAFVLLALGAWRTIAAAAATTGLLVALSLLLFGIEPWTQYLTTTREFQLELLREWRGFYVLMMPTWFAPLRTAGMSYAAAMAIQTLVTIAVMGATTWAVRQTRDPALRAFIVAAATPLALPYSFNYDLPALAVASVWLITGRISMPPRVETVHLVAWYAPLLMMIPEFHSLAIAPAALTGLFASAIWLAASNNKTRRQPLSGLTARQAA